jgi:hypothetical protein
MFDCIMLVPLSATTHGMAHCRSGHTSCHGAHVKNDIKGEYILSTNLSEAKLKSP